MRELYGTEFLDHYADLEAALRCTQPAASEGRWDMLEDIEELKAASLEDLDCVESMSDSSDSEQEEVQVEGVNDVKSDSEEEDWNLFHENTSKDFKPRLHHAFPEINVEYLFCPGDQHVLSQVDRRPDQGVVETDYEEQFDSDQFADAED